MARVLLLSTRDVGSRATGRIVVLRTHLDALAALGSAPYTVTAESNRVGMRLDGPVLERSRTEELPSEGVVRGSLQVPPTGQPTLFLADHPVTGGYPVIGVVLSVDVDLAAQAQPGQRLRFHLTDGGSR